jgi:hypothetical protein
MQCHEFEQRLNDLLDERLSPERDQILSVHAAQCPDCRQLLVGQQVLLEGLRMGPGVGLRDRFAAEVIASHSVDSAVTELTGRSGPGAEKASWGWLVGLGLATAAAALVAVSIYLTTDPEGPQLAGAPGANQVDILPGNGASSTAGRASGLSRYTPEGGYGVAIAGFVPEAVEQFENVERYAPGIRPLRVSFAMLWDALRRTIPGLYDDAPASDKAWLSPASFERIV